MLEVVLRVGNLRRRHTKTESSVQYVRVRGQEWWGDGDVGTMGGYGRIWEDMGIITICREECEESGNTV